MVAQEHNGIQSAQHVTDRFNYTKTGYSLSVARFRSLLPAWPMILDTEEY